MKPTFAMVSQVRPVKVLPRGRHFREDLQPAWPQFECYNAYSSIIRGGHTF